MKKEMTWEQRWNMHNELRRTHSANAIKAIHAFSESRNPKDYDEYKRESQLANKHSGIAQAMFTRKHGKI